MHGTGRCLRLKYRRNTFFYKSGFPYLHYTTITLLMTNLKQLAFSKEYLMQCRGYNPEFTLSGLSISLDKILPKTFRDHLPLVEGNKKRILHYTDLSVLYHSKRRVPILAACNINGAEKANQSPRPAFRADPRIDAEIQLSKKKFYDLIRDRVEFEIGHMASNNEMGRGTKGPLKAFQTFHFTNSVPQVEKLNTGLWKGLESYVIKEAASITGNKKISVFTGPVLHPRDPVYIKDPSFQIPLLFFKVIVFPSVSGVFATAFVMSHEKKLKEDKLIKPAPRRVRGKAVAEAPISFTDYPYKDVFQVSIPLLEELTTLQFKWKGVQPLAVPGDKNLIRKIRNVKDASEAKKSIRRVRGGVFQPQIPKFTGGLTMILP